VSGGRTYQQILKMTSLFGGVQFFTILISILRTKLIAVFIGPEGMGVITLLNSTLSVINSISGFGIETSAVKNISENYGSGNLKEVSTTIQVVKKIVFFTGVLGMILTILLSKVLSIITFGDSSQTYSFVFIAVTVLFKQLSSGQLAILQGLRKMKLMAKANLFGNLFGLLFSVPLYYFLRIDAILPTILIASLAALVFSFYYSGKIKIKQEKVSKDFFLAEGKTIMKLGFMLTISSVLTLLSTYLVQVFISKNGGLQQVGFYNAGFTLLNSYVGIIFTVMSTDYFPKLVSINSDNEKIRSSVMQQAFVSIIIITPIIVLFLTLISIIIPIIYTPNFNVVIPMVCFGILGMLFRAVSWAMGFILIAKGDSRIFIKTGIGLNVLSLVMNVFGYYFYGLEGLGCSFFLYFLFHFIGLKWITKKRYDFYFDNEFYKIYFACFIISAVTFLLRYIENSTLKYILMTWMVLISISFSWYQISKKVNLKEMVMSLKSNKKSNNDSK
jgi:O-antigen/teichoic acid export membrane protein